MKSSWRACMNSGCVGGLVLTMGCMAATSEGISDECWDAYRAFNEAAQQWLVNPRGAYLRDRCVSGYAEDCLEWCTDETSRLSYLYGVILQNRDRAVFFGCPENWSASVETMRGLTFATDDECARRDISAIQVRARNRQSAASRGQ